MPNPYVNKVVQSNGTTLIDISDTTAVASDVASGKYFYLATGQKVEGTASGGSTRTTIVPEQTINVSTAYNQITNYVSLIEEGEEYIVTLNGVEYTKTAVSYYGSIALLLYTDVYIERTSSDNLFFDVENSSLYGTYTIKVEQESSGGGGGSAASSWTKVAETSYQVSTTSTSASTVDTWATGHSEIWTSDKFVYVRIRDTEGKRKGHFYGTDTWFINMYPANSESVNNTPNGILTEILAYSSSGLYKCRYGYTTTGYGVYADMFYNDGSIRIQSRYQSTYSLTIDGTYKVEVYLLDPAGGVPIFE